MGDRNLQAKTGGLFGKHKFNIMAILCLVILIIMETGSTLFGGLRGTVTFDPPMFRKVSELILEKTSEQDRIYIWGYSPDLYLYTQRRAASRVVVPQAMVGDYGENETPVLNRSQFEILKADFEKHPPKLFIDVSKVSFSLAELKKKHKTDVYNIDLIPQIKDYLSHKFELIGKIDNAVAFYQWKDQ